METPATGSAGLQAVRVWDLPTRLFHWTLVVCFIGSIVSVKIGGNALEWHLRFGYAVFALLATRRSTPSWWPTPGMARAWAD